VQRGAIVLFLISSDLLRGVDTWLAIYGNLLNDAFLLFSPYLPDHLNLICVEVFTG